MSECITCGGGPKTKAKGFPGPVIEINNPEKLILFRKVVLPASMGTEEDVPASAGKYFNVLLVYEANGHIYLYSSDGVPTLLSTDIGDLSEIERRLSGVEQSLITEISDREAADMSLSSLVDSLSSSLSTEVNARTTEDAAINSRLDTLTTNLATEISVRQTADNSLQDQIDSIEEVIPNQATAQNQLADKAFVNSSVATNTANYISDNGQPFPSLAALEAYSGTLTNNDYAFVVGTDATGNTTYTRYKYNANAQAWAEEYVLNNSSFTAVQWAAINSGITSGAVDKLAALANIKTIGANLNLASDGTLSATDTTYSDFTGTDGTAAGAHGLVPAPATTDAGKYLKADGTWDTVNAGPTVVQSTGTSTTDVMSQKAITDMVYAKNGSRVQSDVRIGHNAIAYNGTIIGGVVIGDNARTRGYQAIAIGGSDNTSTSTDARSNYSIAIGRDSSAAGVSAVALGDGAWTGDKSSLSPAYSVALGAKSTTSIQGELSIGGSKLGTDGYNGSQYRLITNVYDPQSDHDAATKGYVDTAVAGAAGADVFTTNEWNALWA